VPPDLKEKIRCAAVESGFSACGFSTALPLPATALLEQWTSANRHGFMDYLERDQNLRVDPGALLSGAASVIVLALPCAAPPPPPLDWRSSLKGRIASYAAGEDYHHAMGRKLESFTEQLQRLAPGHLRWQVDAGPLLEKDLARRAGLGWFGHNTNILTRDAGSWVMLGVVITTALIEPDPPFEEDHCGSCRACLPSCPTGALDDGPTIQADRCISYLTIELRGPWPLDLRPLVGNWVFGCDLCQLACPWGPSLRAEDSLGEFLYPSLIEILKLSEDDFRDRYRGSAVLRAKRRGLVRNAAVALGNSGNQLAVAPLAEALASDADELVRAHSAWALGQLQGGEARAALNRSAKTQAPPVQAEIELARTECRAAPLQRSR